MVLVTACSEGFRLGRICVLVVFNVWLGRMLLVAFRVCLQDKLIHWAMGSLSAVPLIS